MSTASASSGGTAWALPRRAPLAVSLAVGAIIVPIETIACWLFLASRLADVVMVYLLGVVIVAMRFGHAASLLTATLSVGAFDFFFTAPYFSFAVEDKRYLLTFLIMLFVALVISNLTERIRRSAFEATQRERQTAKLYAMSRELSVASSSESMMEVAYRHLRDVFASDVSILLPGEGGELRPVKTLQPASVLSEAVMKQAKVAFDSNELATTESSFAATTAERLVALRASSGVLGVLVVRPALPDYFADGANQQLLGAFASQIASAIERARLAEDAQQAQLETQRERLRNALLSSVSHDLRTPLAVVKGAATALLEEDGTDLPDSRRREYLETISDEASRLNRLVRNLLDMTSLEAGALRVVKVWQPLEEVVGVVLNRLEEQLERRPVKVHIPAEAALVPFDAGLLEHVLMNLVENAIKYTPPGSPIDIGASAVEGGVEVEVTDHGAGVPPGQETQIFEKFHRVPSRVSGMGLGLTICRGILSVHGGSIRCENRATGGASFRFFLPREGEAPPMNILPEVNGDS